MADRLDAFLARDLEANKEYEQRNEQRNKEYERRIAILEAQLKAERFVTAIIDALFALIKPKRSHLTFLCV